MNPHWDRQKELDQALIWAVDEKDAELTKGVLAKGASPMAMDRQEKPALTIAIMHGSEEIVRMLLEAGADPMKATRGGDTPMHWAALWGQGSVRAMMGLLLAAGADLNAKSSSGETPLHTAAAYGNLETIGILLEMGASPKLKNRQGLRPDERTSSQEAKALIEAKRLSDLESGKLERKAGAGRRSSSSRRGL